MTGKLLLAAAAIAGFSGSAIGADLYRAPAQPEAPVAQAPAATDFDGPYIGASLGYAWGTASDATAPDTASLQGWTIGGQLGYNTHVSDNIVAGVEGDLNWSNEQGTYAATPANSFRKNWDGSVRGRLGVDLDGIMPYVEAGVAFANETQTVAAASSGTHAGWTAGAGIEFKLADQVSANVEYRYSNYGSQTLGADSVGLTDNTVKVGLNYHF
jgi:outer membrane immunogenic protein